MIEPNQYHYYTPQSNNQHHKPWLIVSLAVGLGLMSLGLLAFVIKQAWSVKPNQVTPSTFNRQLQNSQKHSAQPTLADLRVLHPDNSTKTTLALDLRQTPLTITGISLRLKLKPMPSAKDQAQILRSIRLNPDLKKIGYQLMIKQFNVSSSSLDLALINPASTLPAFTQTRLNLIEFKLPANFTNQQLILDQNNSLIALKSGEVGLINQQ